MTTTLSVKGPDDLLAAVPILLGFVPERSIVMLTFGGEHQFHARIDLPRRPADVDTCLDTLLLPALRYGVRGVVLVLYDAGDTGEAVAARVPAKVDEHGVPLLGFLSVADGRWYDPLGLHDGLPEGVPYDVGSHAFRAQSVAEGHVVLGSRDEVAATLRALPEQVAETEAALETARVLSRHQVSRLVTAGLPGGLPTSAQVASLLLSLTVGDLRDAAWEGMRRATAGDHVAFWADVVRRSPDGLVAHPAAVLAFAAWLEGHGALAWCALDRCFAQDRRHRLGLLVARLLEAAVPPTEWDRAASDVRLETA